LMKMLGFYRFWLPLNQNQWVQFVFSNESCSFVVCLLNSFCLLVLILVLRMISKGRERHWICVCWGFFVPGVTIFMPWIWQLVISKLFISYSILLT
jgi:hypothetical protein